jgi:two-component system, cell cycle sensor histidine kinase and response regulator CckA
MQNIPYPESFGPTDEALRQRQKMEALGLLATGVAHDFNNLLTAINGYSDLLLGLLAKGDSNRELVEEIRKAGEKGVALTAQLLAYSRKQKPEVKAQDLRPILVGMEKLLTRLLPNSIRLVLVANSESQMALIDANRVEQALINLVVNARDAISGEGQIDMGLHRLRIESWPEHTALMPAVGEYIALTVTDTGSGITQEIMARLWEPFFTTKTTGQGTGLGLSTVFSIAQEMGGAVAVASELGKGSAFTLYLPALEKQLI